MPVGRPKNAGQRPCTTTPRAPGFLVDRLCDAAASQGKCLLQVFGRLVKSQRMRVYVYIYMYMRTGFATNLRFYCKQN